MRLQVDLIYQRRRTGKKVKVVENVGVILTQIQLNILFGSSTHVRILKGGAHEGKALGNELLAEARGKDVAALREALRVKIPPSPFRCLCRGSHAIEFWKGDTLLTTIAYHHHSTLRSALGLFDAYLKEPAGLADWLSERGIDELSKDIEEGKQRKLQQKDTRSRWVASAPVCLRSQLWLFESCMPLASMTIQRSYPDQKDACRALLRWYGQGAGPWSGFPSYEEFPVRLLGQYHSETIKSVILDGLNCPTLTRGAARLLGSAWKLELIDPALRELPINVWERFREAVSRQAIDDNLYRLERAFELVHS